MPQTGYGKKNRTTRNRTVRNRLVDPRSISNPATQSGQRSQSLMGTSRKNKGGARGSLKQKANCFGFRGGFEKGGGRSTRKVNPARVLIGEGTLFRSKRQDIFITFLRGGVRWLETDAATSPFLARWKGLKEKKKASTLKSQATWLSKVAITSRLGRVAGGGGGSFPGPLRGSHMKKGANRLGPRARRKT